MLIQYAPPSKHAGEWRRLEVGTTLVGIRVNFIVFESPDEIKKCVEHLRWFAELALNFYPSKRPSPFSPAQLVDINLPLVKPTLIP